MDAAIIVEPSLGDTDILSYDDTVPYEDQMPTEGEVKALAGRIGNTRVYLLESTSSRVGKVRRPSCLRGLASRT